MTSNKSLEIFIKNILDEVMSGKYRIYKLEEYIKSFDFQKVYCCKNINRFKDFNEIEDLYKINKIRYKNY